MYSISLFPNPFLSLTFFSYIFFHFSMTLTFSLTDYSHLSVCPLVPSLLLFSLTFTFPTVSLQTVSLSLSLSLVDGYCLTSMRWEGEWNSFLELISCSPHGGWERNGEREKGQGKWEVLAVGIWAKCKHSEKRRQNAWHSKYKELGTNRRGVLYFDQLHDYESLCYCL